ncbi:hypothetical protein P3T76_013847 [Phytophthora citrophthora]|uniref:Uncharacterized protein n=1 Tax=Phytophthora citrophthora TaxID=4793 RepID=A0AAD9G2G3_9STRA|nr:hypothetical protein P3T76_013847 [Phytophthora citrophthora]
MMSRVRTPLSFGGGPIRRKGDTEWTVTFAPDNVAQSLFQPLTISSATKTLFIRRLAILRGNELQLL